MRIFFICFAVATSCSFAMCDSKQKYSLIVDSDTYIARPHYGYSNGIKNPSIDLLLALIGEEGSEELILDLFEVATSEGKLYFLSALYFVNQITFENKVKSLRANGEIVTLVEGDQKFTKSISSSMISKEAINVPRGKFVDELIQDGDHISLDFLGGGYPVMLFDSAFDLGVFLKADDLTRVERESAESSYSERRTSLRKALFSEPPEQSSSTSGIDEAK